MAHLIKTITGQINLGFRNILDTFYNIFFEFKKTRKYEHSLNCDVILIHSTGLAEKYSGLTDESNNILLVPLLLRIYSNLKPIYLEGKKTFYIRDKYHGTLNMIKLGEISESIKNNINVSYNISKEFMRYLSYYWQYNSNCFNFKLKHISGTIDTSLYDNEFSSDFTAMSFKIIITKALAFLEETPRRIFILSLIVALVFGMFIGTPLGMIIAGIIMYFIR